MPENSKLSPGSRLMMSSICIAMTATSFGVSAKAVFQISGVAAAEPIRVRRVSIEGVPPEGRACPGP